MSKIVKIVPIRNVVCSRNQIKETLELFLVDLDDHLFVKPANDITIEQLVRSLRSVIRTNEFPLKVNKVGGSVLLLKTVNSKQNEL